MGTNSYHEFDGSVVKILSCSNCNANCRHCYISFKGNYTRELLTEVVNSLIQKYEVRINGTEPLLHREYLECIKKTMQHLVLTNGLVFRNNLDYIDELKDYDIDTIGISYHFDFHDDISPVSKLYLEDLFREIIKRGVNVQVMTTITSSNYDKVLDYCKWCHDMGIQKIRFTNFMLQGHAVDLDRDLVLSDEQRYKFFEEIELARSIYPKEVLEIQRCGSFGRNPNAKKEFFCGGGRESIVLTPDLKAYPCLFFAKEGNEIGFYQDGKIFIDDGFVPEEKECSAIKRLNKVI